MTLLLGPPGAGKTTLLKALSGKLRGLKVSHLQMITDQANMDVTTVNTVNVCLCTFQGQGMIACARLTCIRVGVQLTGDITYNGHTLDEFVVQRTAAYVEQTDLHIPEVRRSRVSS